MLVLYRHPPSGTLHIYGARQQCVYMLASRFNGTLSTGVTSSLIGRTIQHLPGAFGGFTKRYGVRCVV